MDFASADSSEVLTPLQHTRPCGMSPSPITPGGPPALHPLCGAWVPRRTSLRETGDWTRPGFERVAKPTPPARRLEKGGRLPLQVQLKSYLSRVQISGKTWSAQKS